MLFTSGFVDDAMFYVMELVGQNERRPCVSSSLPGGGTGGDICCLRLPCFSDDV